MISKSLLTSILFISFLPTKASAVTCVKPSTCGYSLNGSTYQCGDDYVKVNTYNYFLGELYDNSVPLNDKPAIKTAPLRFEEGILNFNNFTLSGKASVINSRNFGYNIDNCNDFINTIINRPLFKVNLIAKNQESKVILQSDIVSFVGGSYVPTNGSCTAITNFSNGINYNLSTSTIYNNFQIEYIPLDNTIMNGQFIRFTGFDENRESYLKLQGSSRINSNINNRSRNFIYIPPTETRYDCKGDSCSLVVRPEEVKNYLQCPSPETPYYQYVNFAFSKSNSDRIWNPLKLEKFIYQKILFDVDFQPPETIELNANNQYECNRLKEIYSNLFTFNVASESKFRVWDVPNDPLNFYDTQKVFLIGNNFDPTSKKCLLKTNFNGIRYTRNFINERGIERDFKISFNDINEYLIYSGTEPLITKMFKESTTLKITGLFN